ncbi:alpha/beta fold hydrolase [Rhizobium leguminosarum]|uniref:alpha/beta fold hydrolase n=1 Tax=Rhizobium leguminosarum TaxID=384 RepID=UPI001441D253|nr:alpha/beta hydrolase [Rhizobium leguminosarum]MBY5819822.1 alpha/beta hydrolase [Rhizobium leguminosarum]NKK99679.1 alpha/beta fold hydrolase [Rhizobium leguminosarum bv. viciae]NKL79323.1 alpha/beta fold hydrolase [Rhizobium leguminosarum bv. viciae]
MPFLDAPIVLVHGLFGNLAEPEILAAFGKVEIQAPDLIGYGRHQDRNVENLALSDQANHIAEHIHRSGGNKVHLVGHSVGGAVSALVCALYPDLVASFTSVEGNFTLKDAFWSGQIAEKPEMEVTEIINGYKADADAWIAAAGVPINPWTSALATRWLSNQPASTIKAQAKAVVAATSHDSYLAGIRNLIASSIPVYLIAGARSASGWNVPDWANEACTMRINIPDTGHLMMAEAPTLFAKSVLTCLSYR